MGYNATAAMIERKRGQFPPIIEVQTSALCNALCAICPQSTQDADDSQGIMSDDMWNKILDECRAKMETGLFIPI